MMIDPTGTGFATATDNCDNEPTVTFSDVTTPGSCAGDYVMKERGPLPMHVAMMTSRC